jgi:hypothetical protein
VCRVTVVPVLNSSGALYTTSHQDMACEAPVAPRKPLVRHDKRRDAPTAALRLARTERLCLGGSIGARQRRTFGEPAPGASRMAHTRTRSKRAPKYFAWDATVALRSPALTETRVVFFARVIAV